MEYKIYTGLNDDIISIRTSVFILEQGFKNEFDNKDNTCSHIVLYSDGKAVATCRYYKEGKSYHIGRVAIIKEYRGQHLGHEIMKIAEAKVKAECVEKPCMIEVSAQVRVSEFYEKLGYNKVGEIYLDEFCEHIRMVKYLGGGEECSDH